jgi:hypothetical protein
MIRAGCRQFLLGAFALAFIAACGGPSLQGPLAVSSAASRSWIAPNAKAQDLLYISDLGANAVDVYSYPDLKLVGSLHGFGSVAGLCSDTAGTVFVVDEAGPVEVYAHGGSTPIRSLATSGAPYGCAVDPTTGNLALTQLSSYLYSAVWIYPKAKGAPAKYNDEQIDSTYFCGYDPNGNLIVDGWNRSAQIILVELPKHGKSLRIVNFGDGKSGTTPGGVQWDGTYVAVADKGSGAIYRTSEGGKVAQTVKLTDGANVLQFWIAGSTLIGPNAQSPGTVGFWRYPAGGAPTKTLKGFYYPFGATLSAAK